MTIDIHAALIVIATTLVSVWIFFGRPAVRAHRQRVEAPAREDTYYRQLHRMQAATNDLRNIQASAETASERIALLMAKAEVQARQA